MRVKKFRPKESRDKLIYGDGIVEGIVLLAVSEIPYAEIYRGVIAKQPAENAVKVVIDKSNVEVNVTVTIHYSQSVSDMAFKIQEAVKYNVESMTDFTVTAVNVIVKGVTFEDVSDVPQATNTNANESSKATTETATENATNNDSEKQADDKALKQQDSDKTKE